MKPHRIHSYFDFDWNIPQLRVEQVLGLGLGLVAYFADVVPDLLRFSSLSVFFCFHLLFCFFLFSSLTFSLCFGFLFELFFACCHRDGDGDGDGDGDDDEDDDGNDRRMKK